MGIRFACPNGHPLHVKAELAGKRGICPECQVRFVIPRPAEQAAAPQPEPAKQPAAAKTAPAPAPAPAAPTPAPAPAAAAAATSPAPVESPPPPAPAPTPAPVAATAPPSPTEAPAAAPPTPAPEAAPAEQPMWYVRPASGGQFGPADDALVHQWAGEGRLAGDSYVWRTGWPEWRRASDVPEHFPELAAQSTAAAALPTNSDYNDSTNAGGTQSAEAADVSLATARYKRRKMRSKRSQQLAAAVLVLLTVVLAGVLVWVLVSSTSSPDEQNTTEPTTNQQPAEPPPANEEGEAATEPGEADESETADADQ